MTPLPGFNYRVLFAPPAAEDLALETGGDPLATAVARAGLVNPAPPAGAIRAGFAEVSGLNSELDIEEYREGGRNLGPRRFPKWGRYPNLVLRRGVTSDATLWDWWADVLTRSYTLPAGRTPLVTRRNGVILLDGLDHTAVAGWFFANALPERLIGPGLSARSNELAIETLELSHEGLLRLPANSLPR